MRYMIFVKANKDTEAGIFPPEPELSKLFSAMTAYHEELQKAGVLLDAAGLQPSSKGFKVKYTGSKRTVVDGPFAEAKELVAGYTLIEVKSREEAIEWARRYPNPIGEGKEAEIEVRLVYELDDLGPHEGVERFRELEQARKR